MNNSPRFKIDAKVVALSLIIAGVTLVAHLMAGKGSAFLVAGVALAFGISFFFIAFTSSGSEKIRQKVEERDSEIIEYRTLVGRLETSNKELQKKVEEKGAAPEPKISDARQAEVLLSISQALNQTLELKTLLSLTLTKVKELVGFHSGGVFLYNADKSELYVAATEGFYEPEMKMQLSPEIGIPAIVAQTNKPLMVPNTLNDPRFNRIRQSARVDSAMYVPISLGKEIYGCVGLWSMEQSSYGPQHLELLQTVTAEAARAIRNAELYEKLDTRLNFIVSLWETSKSLTSSVDISSAAWEKVLGEVLTSARYLFGAEKVAFFRYQKERKSLEPYVVLGFSPEAQMSRDIVISSESADINFLLRSTFQVKECRKDPRFAFFSNLAIRENLTSLLWSPLIGRQRIIGTLALFSSQMRSWTTEETQWLDIFGNMLSMTLENIFLLQDLFSEKNQLQVLIDNMPEGVFTTDADGLVLTWNIAATHITGWSLGEVAGRNCAAFVACQTVDMTWCTEGCPSRQAMREGAKVDSGLNNVFVKNRQEVKIPVFITSAPIYNEEGKVAGSIVVFRDITKEKEIEQMKEDFLATITHDLKSPLASIMGYTELLLNPKLGEVSTTQKEFLEAILRSSKTLQILISNILESTRMEAGKAVYNMGLFNLDALLAELAEMFRPMTQHKHIGMKIEMDESVIVYGDREKIKEIFINLYSNAVKFTGEKGLISTVGEISDAKVTIKVSDTGKGIPQKAIATLFQKFSQVKGEKGGTGLGLYIVRRILEAHGQEVSVESIEGRGTTFTFTLDRFKPEEKAPAPKDDAKLLIVDKDRASADRLKRTLEEEGFESNAVFTVSNALLMAQGDPPDVIVLDSKLPDLDLQGFYDQLKSSAVTAGIPIILVCEWREDVPSYIDAYLYKPIDHKDFFKKLRNLLKEKRSRETR